MSMSVNANDLRALTERLRDIDRKALPEAMVRTLNYVAFDVMKENQREMARVFDRPTRWTLNAFRVAMATKANPVAEVLRKDMVGRRHYLEVQSEGGARPMTGLERLLSRNLAYDGIIQAVLPAPGIRKNAYGNIAPGTIQRILSAVQAQGDRAQNTTSASRRRAGARRSQYFVPRTDSRLSPGVYERKPNRSIKKMLAFSDASPRYSVELDFDDNAREVVERQLEPTYRRELAKALAKA